MVVARDALPAPELPRELVEVEGLGQLVVQGLSFSAGVRYVEAMRRAREALPGEMPDERADRLRGEMVPMLLSLCVFASDDRPAFTRAQWAAWGGRHPEAVLDLFKVAMRLSGTDADAEKKS